MERQRSPQVKPFTRFRRLQREGCRLLASGLIFAMKPPIARTDVSDAGRRSSRGGANLAERQELLAAVVVGENFAGGDIVNPGVELDVVLGQSDGDGRMRLQILDLHQHVL